jgi:hypothetical protein
MRTLILGVFLSVCVFATSASALDPKGLCGDELKPKAGDLAAAEKAAADAWSKRADEKQLQLAIEKLKEASAIDPKKAENWVKLGKALYLWADGHLRLDEDREDEMVPVFKRSVYAFERAIRATNPDYTFAVCAKDPIKKVVSTIRKQDLDAIYWYSTALGKYGLASSITEVLGNKDRIYAFIRRVGKLDSKFNYGAAHRYLGAFFTKIPFPKGDVKKSRKHFEKSIAIAPNYLATRVLMAKMLAPKLKDRALFKAQLDYVLNAKDDVISGLAPEHALEKKKAKLLLADIDDIFGDEG